MATQMRKGSRNYLKALDVTMCLFILFQHSHYPQSPTSITIFHYNSSKGSRLPDSYIVCRLYKQANKDLHSGLAHLILLQ